MKIKHYILPLFLALVLFPINGVRANPALCSLLYTDSRLAPYFEFQINDSCCSLASSTPIFNAILAKEKLNGHSFIRQQQMLKKLDNPIWTKAVARDGDGLVLADLGKYFEAGLKKLGVSKYKVETIYFKEIDPRAQERLENILNSVAKSKDEYVIFNFLQSEFTGNPLDNYGHFSPVGRYDEKLQKILVLDTDSSIGGPYEISLKQALKGMTTIDRESGLSRGLIYIKKIE